MARLPLLDLVTAFDTISLEFLLDAAVDTFGSLSDAPSVPPPPTVVALVVEHARLMDRVALPVPRCVAPLAMWLRAVCEIVWAHLACGQTQQKTL